MGGGPARARPLLHSFRSPSGGRGRSLALTFLLPFWWAHFDAAAVPTREAFLTVPEVCERQVL